MTVSLYHTMSLKIQTSRYYIMKEKVTECRAKRLKNGSAKFPTQANNVPRDGPPNISMTLLNNKDQWAELWGFFFRYYAFQSSLLLPFLGLSIISGKTCYMTILIIFFLLKTHRNFIIFNFLSHACCAYSQLDNNT